MLAYFPDFSPYQHLLISLALGLLVGLQREWAITPMAGIRSFALISLLGTITALMQHQFGKGLIELGFVATLAITIIRRITLAKINNAEMHKSFVTEVSVLLMYLIGVMVVDTPMIAAATACLMAAILQVKLELHAIVKRFSKSEIRSLMQFLIITLVIFPIVPNQSFGPQNALNLHNVWLMVILIVGISFGGHIIYKFTGEKTGVLWGGILGGLISSTATTLGYSRESQSPTSSLSFNAHIILIAWATLYIRVYLELWLVSPQFNVSLPLLIMLITSLITIYWSWKKNYHDLQGQKLEYNPTGITTALIFALSYSIILYVFAFLKDQFGSGGLSIISFISGIMDVDAITLSTGRLVHKNLISHQEGMRYFFLAIVANALFKGFITLIIGGRKLFRIILLPWIVTSSVAILILIFSFSEVLQI